MNYTYLIELFIILRWFVIINTVSWNEKLKASISFETYIPPKGQRFLEGFRVIISKIADP